MATVAGKRPIVEASEIETADEPATDPVRGLRPDGRHVLSSLDQTIVGTAIRTIGDDLNGMDQQAWVTTAYMIAATVTTPL